MKLILQIFLLYLTISLAMSSENYTSEYQGQETRKIKSLSADDIAELTKGGGWGLAKAAELNGYPGPAHILEMSSKIDLNEKQKTQINELFKKMKVDAKALGIHLIRLEEKLNGHFANGSINHENMENLVVQIQSVHSKLRLVHLSTHLQTPKILSPEQINLYNELRGYSKDPCTNIPEGHNAKMWLKHNGCK